MTSKTTKKNTKLIINGEDNDSDDNDLRNNVYWYCKA